MEVVDNGWTPDWKEANTVKSVEPRDDIYGDATPGSSYNNPRIIEISDWPGGKRPEVDRSWCEFNAHPTPSETGNTSFTWSEPPDWATVADDNLKVDNLYPPDGFDPNGYPLDLSGDISMTCEGPITFTDDLGLRTLTYNPTKIKLNPVIDGKPLEYIFNDFTV